MFISDKINVDEIQGKIICGFVCFDKYYSGDQIMKNEAEGTSGACGG
jgi:hypothetical protein